MNDTPTICLTGRIDSANAAEWEKKLSEQTAGKNDIVIDASELVYISSAGLRIIMKLKKAFGENIRIVNVSPDVYDIFDVTGFTEMMSIEKRFREISVEGCEIIGKGFYGTVYRIDDETIVKLYDSPDSLPMIRNEQRLAKRAFVKGVPTAISYDIVKAGDRFGSVFELLKAETFNDILIKDPSRFDEIMRIYAGFLKTVHNAEMDPGTLPMARDNFKGYLDAVRIYLTDEQYLRIKELLSALPDDLHTVHGDFQMKNVMMAGNEPMLIDMDTLSTGQPVFDLQALYVTYMSFPEDDPDNLRDFLGIPNDWGTKIWQSLTELYFGDAGGEKLSAAIDKIQLLAAVRFLYIVTSCGLKEGELGEKRIRRSQEHITELIGRVKDLML